SRSQAWWRWRSGQTLPAIARACAECPLPQRPVAIAASQPGWCRCRTPSGLHPHTAVPDRTTLQTTHSQQCRVSRYGGGYGLPERHCSGKRHWHCIPVKSGRSSVVGSGVVAGVLNEFVGRPPILPDAYPAAGTECLAQHLPERSLINLALNLQRQGTTLLLMQLVLRQAKGLQQVGDIHIVEPACGRFVAYRRPAIQLLQIAATVFVFNQAGVISGAITQQRQAGVKAAGQGNFSAHLMA